MTSKCAPSLLAIVAAVALAACTSSVIPSPSSAPSSVPSAAPSTEPLGFAEQPKGVPWPTEAWATADWPAGVDQAAVEAATDVAFADGGVYRVRATLIVHGGAIVYERYAPNSTDGRDVVMPAHSMAKSVTSALIGVLVRDGLLDITDPAPVPEWHADPADPRAEITVEHMLHMATGMPWTDDVAVPNSDMAQMVGSDDMAAYAAAQHPALPVGEYFQYNTGTSTLLARMVAEVAGDSPEDTTAFLHEQLFDRIGMGPMELYFDEAGNWGGGFSADTTARSYAKFGLLYARGGEWDGEQLLPDEWVNFTRSPSPAEPEYGAHWWLDLERPGVSYAVGIRGQVITVDPAHDLVIVQLSTIGGELPLTQTEVILDAFAEGLGAN